jgi:hypothetical protein
MTLALQLHASAVPRRELPLVFAPNHGQWPAEVRLMARTPGLSAYFLTREVHMDFGGQRIRIQFPGAAIAAPEGVKRTAGSVNFLVGEPEDWRTGVPVFQQVVYRNLDPGIDLIFGSQDGRLKSEFVVAPGADPGRIRMSYACVGKVSVEEDGALALPLPGQVIREQAPTIYQYRGDSREEVAGRFDLRPDGSVGFQMQRYDRTRTLVIDPLYVYSTLLGGAGADSVTSLAIDASGSAYVAGFTDSTNFPTANPVRNFNSGGVDAFVAKLSATGNSLVYCTYIGGSADDRAYGIAVDSSGAAYVTGSTTSANFPTMRPIQALLQGGRNAFVLKLNPTGNTLLFSTYLGGNGSDSGNGIALDPAGNAYVVGDTTSINFPATGFQPANQGGQDAFVAKLANDGSALIYGTYLGGSGADRGAGIAVDSGGIAYVTGSTQSTDFPVANAAQPVSGGGQDAFVTRLSADGSTLLFSTYLGGSGGTAAYPEAAQAIALDAAGNAYVAGVTSSVDFPLMQPIQAVRHGFLDAFVTKLSSAGTISYSTYFGGYGIDFANAIAVDATGSAYIAGYTYSTDLPAASGLQTASGGDTDAFVARISAAGDAFPYVSYLGGSGSDSANALALDGAGRLYVAGLTQSSNFPLANAYQSVNGGGYGAFVSAIGFSGPPVNVSLSPNSGSGLQQTFTAQFADPGGAGNLTSAGILITTGSSTTRACGALYDAVHNQVSLLGDDGTPLTPAISPGAGSQQNSQCILDGASSSVSRSATTLTLRLAFRFQLAFAGSQNLLLSSSNPSGSTGWQSFGSWTVPAPSVAAISVTPGSGSAATQVFGFQFSDSLGAADLSTVWMYITPGFSSSSSANTCILYYDRAANRLNLENDTGTAWSGAIVGASGSLQNSQCSASLSSASVTQSGNNLTLSVPLTFTGAFTGTKQVWMYAGGSRANSGWQHLGDWTVPVMAVLASISPNTTALNSGSVNLTATGSGFVSGALIQWTPPGGGAATTISATFVSQTQLTATVPPGLLVAGISQVAVLSGGVLTAALPFTVVVPQLTSISPATATVNSASFTITANGVGFANGASIQWTASGVTTPLATTLISSTQLQATVPAGLLTAVGAAQVAVKNADNSLTATQSFAILAPSGAYPVSMTPNTGSGASQTFQFQFADSLGAADLRTVWIYITPSFNSTSSANTCILYYDRAANRLNLENDAGTAWMAGTAGAAGSLQNSQCNASLPSTAVTQSGAYLTISLPLTFSGAFAGTKQVWMYAGGSAASGWQHLGDWTVSFGLQLSSISPASAPAYAGPVTLTANGYGFMSGASIQFTPAGGATTTLATSFISATQLQGTIPANLLTGQGSVQIVVKNADNSLTTAQSFAILVPSGVNPVSLTPNSGSGASQTFQFQFADSLGAADLRSVWVYITPSFSSSNSANTCIFYYDRAASRLNLENDAGMSWLAGSVGAGGSLQNSQCSLSLSSTTVTQSGGYLTVSVPVTFTPAFTGLKQVRMYAAGSAANSGWVRLGTWTAP